MSFLKHNFSEETKADLLQFLKVALETQLDNNFCDMEKYEKLKDILPLDKKIKNELQAYINHHSTVCIEIPDSDNDDIEVKNKIDTNKTTSNLVEELSQIFTPPSCNQSNDINIEDIVYAIQENLETKKQMPAEILESLKTLPNKKLEIIFKKLNEELSLESTHNFWLSIQEAEILNDFVVVCFIRMLLLKKAQTEFCDEIQQIYKSLSTNYPILLKKELANEFLINHGTSDERRILLQYFNVLDSDFKSKLLREFLEKCNKLEHQHISFIDALLHNQTPYDFLSKVIEVMSHAVSDFSTDKPYGKLLLKIVKLLDKRVSQIEQPLKHILGLHKSMWKKEIERHVVVNFEDTMTQF